MHRTVRVLIIDDHAIIREIVGQLLEMEQDLQVVGKGVNADEAVVLTDRLQPDVVVLDLRMPGKSGIDVLGDIQRRHPQVRIIIYTSLIDPETTRKALQAGAVACLLKTDSLATLVEAIRSTSVDHLPQHVGNATNAASPKSVWPAMQMPSQAIPSLAS